MDEQQMYQVAKQHAESKIRFYIHSAVFLGVNLLLMIINLWSSPGHLWFLWPFFGWGVGLVIHGLAVLGVFDFSAARKRLIEKEMAKEKYRRQMGDNN